MFADRYLKNLLKLFEKIQNLDYISKDKVWIEEYYEIKGKLEDNLPEALSLIHPDFYFSKGQSFKDNTVLKWKANDFARGITNQTKCKSEKIFPGSNCMFNNYPAIRGKCHADHHWPNSLGGPSILDNRLVLCRFHNSMKSNSIYFNKVENLPDWLPKQINLIYNLKK